MGPKCGSKKRFRRVDAGCSMRSCLKALHRICSKCAFVFAPSATQFGPKDPIPMTTPTKYAPCVCVCVCVRIGFEE
eukprot:2303903-Amphidinium_carterae.1